ncbi:hypothetical protein SAMN05444972_102296 [Marininema halotolerans]|uniref:Uncharacterized protein n=1 Tax=Marininema halotolerans TaxID=1155944 RepID=A0A1I6Q324_9BACL|nr:hypothetical protein SAMN05444972_102296 [Marininema halotolerans]
MINLSWSKSTRLLKNVTQSGKSSSVGKALEEKSRVTRGVYHQYKRAIFMGVPLFLIRYGNSEKDGSNSMNVKITVIYLVNPYVENYISFTSLHDNLSRLRNATLIIQYLL